MKLIMRVVVPNDSSFSNTGPPQSYSQLSCISCEAVAMSSPTDQCDDISCFRYGEKSRVELSERWLITAGQPSGSDTLTCTKFIEVSFKGEGTEQDTLVVHEDHRYKAICLSSGVTVCSSMTFELLHPHPVVRIETEGEELVFVTVIDQRFTPLDKFNLATIATKLARESFPLGDNRGSVVFPLIGLSCQGSLPLVENEGYRGMLMLEQSQQELITMNPSALDATFIRMPFLLWIMRDEDLVFAAYLDRDCWVPLHLLES